MQVNKSIFDYASPSSLLKLPVRAGKGRVGRASKTNDILGEDKLIRLTEGFTSTCSLRTFPCAE